MIAEKASDMIRADTTSRV